jgi:hypothetical protein
MEERFRSWVPQFALERRTFLAIELSSPRAAFHQFPFFRLRHMSPIQELPACDWGGGLLIAALRISHTFPRSYPESVCILMGRPNSAFKPKLHRYAVNMAGRACHVARYALQFGLT